MRKKDVVLMATVTSFEAIKYPSRTELKQFAELFLPLYQNSSHEARKQAVAALSQQSTLPASICYFIGTQPISISAPFLARCPALADDTLIAIARSQGADHAKAIAQRNDLSPKLVDALAAIHNGSGVETKQKHAWFEIDAESGADAISDTTSPNAMSEKEQREAARLAREEAIREDLKFLLREERSAPPPPLVGGLTGLQEALLVRFSRNREAGFFAATLAEAIQSSHWLSERIMLDLSGRQMATTLVALGMPVSETREILCRFYPHLLEASQGRTRAHQLILSLDTADCALRLAAWRRADHYTNNGDLEEMMPEAANSDESPKAPAKHRHVPASTRRWRA